MPRKPKPPKLHEVTPAEIRAAILAADAALDRVQGNMPFSISIRLGEAKGKLEMLEDVVDVWDASWAAKKKGSG